MTCSSLKINKRQTKETVCLEYFLKSGGLKQAVWANYDALQVQATLTLLYELPLIEKCWRELLSLVLICMHDNLFHLKEY